MKTNTTIILAAAIALLTSGCDAPPDLGGAYPLEDELIDGGSGYAEEFDDEHPTRQPAGEIYGAGGSSGGSDEIWYCETRQAVGDPQIWCECPDGEVYPIEECPDLP